MTPVEAQVLETLSVYRFLTLEQMQRIGVARDRKHLGERLNTLASHGLIGVLTWGVYPGLGRLPRMFHLKAKGAKALAGFVRVDEAEVPYVPGAPKFEMDHLHRRATVDCHIALNQWAEREGRKVHNFRAYYFAKPLRLRLPSGQGLSPDAVFDVTNADGQPVLTALEVCLDRRGTDRARILKQMESHRAVMETGALADALGLQRGNRLLAAFESAASRDAIRQSLAADIKFSAFSNLFLFVLLEDLRQDFDNWHDLNGQPVAI